MDYSDFFKKVLDKTDEIEKPKETIGFDIIKEKTNIDDCKIGGIPYFPKNMEYPTDDKNQPLVLLHHSIMVEKLLWKQLILSLVKHIHILNGL